MENTTYENLLMFVRNAVAERCDAVPPPNFPSCIRTINVGLRYILT